MYIFKHRQRIGRKKVFDNKAQITFFLILGLVLLFAFIGGFFIYNKIKTENTEEESKRIAELNLQADNVQKYIDECIRKTSYDGLIRLGNTGGYIQMPNLLNFKGTSYWQIEQANIQPFLNQTQERLIDYININFPKCVESGNFTQFRVQVEKKQPTTSLYFGSNDVTIKINYPIKLSKEKFTKEILDFHNTLDLRYRAVFEAAAEVNKRLFDHDFDIKNPLKNMSYIKQLDFDISYKSPADDVMLFTITDKKSITPANEFYNFNFAVKFGQSELKKLTDMQNKSASNPTVLPYTTYSLDKKAQLNIASGTTIVKDGKDVSFISVQQSYPNEVVTKDVPVYKSNSEVKKKEDITYFLDNPIYSFEPTGLLFNNPQKLTLYYGDQNGKDEKGVGILMGKKGFWVPIESKNVPEEKKVYTNIHGFTEFTAVNCASQPLKTTVAENFFEANGGCWVNLVLIIIVIIIIIIILFFCGPLCLLVVKDVAGVVGAIFTFMSVGVTATIVTGAVVLAIVATGTILQATTDVFYEKSPDNCQNFYPLCDQDVTIEEDGDAEEGKCIPEGNTRVAAGSTKMVCAMVESCGGFIDKMTCKSCSQKCTVKFY